MKPSCFGWILAAAMLVQGQVQQPATATGGTGTGRIGQAPAATAPAEPVRPEERCTVEGDVYSGPTGEPLRKANLTLRRNPTGPNDPLGATYLGATDAGGHFVIPNIEPGRYTLQVEKAGFVTQRYGAKSQMQMGTMLNLQKSQKLKDIAFKLTPHGVITGRILDEDGDPIGGSVYVTVMRSAYMRGKKQMVPAGGGGSANDLGEYRIAGLAAGKYVISAVYRPGGYVMDPVQGGGEETYAPTYYPSATAVETASPVEITAGAQLRGLDIRLRKTRTVRIRGRILGPEGKPSRNVMINLTPRSDLVSNLMITRNMSRPYNAQGDFIISGVIPGSYTLIATQNDGTTAASARAQLDVGTTAIEGVALQLGPGAELTGRIRVEGTATDLASIVVRLQPRNNMMMFGPGTQGGQVKEDGTFTVTNVQADQYDVRAMLAGAYLKSIRLGEDDVTETGVDFTNGVQAAELTLVFSMSPAQVEGSVKNDKSEVAAGATVVLVPEGKRSELDRYYLSASTDQTGHFSMKTVIPGEYRIYAFDSLEFGSYMDPEFMKRFDGKGEKIKMNENGHETLQLKLLSTAEQ